jgi:protein-disulfide isomerase
MIRSLAQRAVSLSFVLLLGCRGQEVDGGTARAAATPPSPAASPDSLTARADAARIQGNPNAPIWVVEVSDFQCPFCKTWHDSTYRALQREFVTPGTIRLAYVNYPLPNHQNALPAAEAAMCAGAQGKFWEVHDGLFDTQNTWAAMPNAASVFDSVARAAGVDVGAMRRCIDQGAMRALIQADAERAQEAGIQATPSFIIGGDVVIRGAQPLAALRRAIAQKLAARSTATP